jgi:AcrR family transcriptional regulator
MLTQRAGSRLGAITELFGGLNALPRAVISRRHGELLTARRDRLGASTNPGMAQIVEAYALPLIERARADSGWKAYSRVWAQLVCAFNWDQKLGASIETDADFFIRRIASAEPRLDMVQSCWAFMLMMGAIGSVCADNGRIDRLSHGAVLSADLELIASKLVPYVLGGIEAVATIAKRQELNDLPVVRRRSKDPRDVILDSAGRMFAAHSFFGTSFRMIARSAGVSVGSCQHYFGTKERLFLETLNRYVEAVDLQRRLLLARADLVERGPDKLREIYAAWLEPPARHLLMGGKGWRDYVRMLTTAINSQGEQWLDALDASYTSVTRSMVEAAATAQPGFTFKDACHAHLFLIGSLALCYSTEDRMRRLSGGAIQPNDYREAYSKLLHFHTGGALALASRNTVG